MSAKVLGGVGGSFGKLEEVEVDPRRADTGHANMSLLAGEDADVVGPYQLARSFCRHQREGSKSSVRAIRALLFGQGADAAEIASWAMLNLNVGQHCTARVSSARQRERKGRAVVKRRRSGQTGSMPASDPDRGTDVIARWKAAGEEGNVAGAVECLAEDVELISPLTAAFRFHGRAELEDVLAAAFEVISDIRYHTDLGDQANRALFYRARVGGMEIEEAQLLRLDETGRIRELTLFGRPLPGLTAVMAGIGPKLLRRQGQAALVPVVTAAVSPLAFLTRMGERHLVPLGDPARGRGRRPKNVGT